MLRGCVSEAVDLCRGAAIFRGKKQNEGSLLTISHIIQSRSDCFERSRRPRRGDGPRLGYLTRIYVGNQLGRAEGTNTLCRGKDPKLSSFLLYNSRQTNIAFPFMYPHALPCPSTSHPPRNSCHNSFLCQHIKLPPGVEKRTIHTLLFVFYQLFYV